MNLGPVSPLQAMDRSITGARSGLGWARTPTPGRGSLLLGALALAMTALALAPLGTSAARTGYALVQQGGKLPVSGEAPGGELGSSEALSADGNTLLVGALKDGDGAVYVFTRSGTTWTQQSKLTAGEGGGAPCSEGCASEGCAEEPGEEGEEASECAFGTSVALSADGNTALVGDPSATAGPGTVWVFTRSGTNWTRSATLLGGDEQYEGRFGRSVALSADGATALVGDPLALGGRGNVWVFAHEGSVWTRERALTDEEASIGAHLGRSVALSADGSTVLAGGPGDNNYTGAVWAFTRSGGGWTQQPGKLTGEGAIVENHFGKSLALSGDGRTALVGAPAVEGGRGAVWTFARSGGAFVEQGAELKAHEFEEGPETEGGFGASLALSGDGSKALIGAPRAGQGIGRVTVLTRSGEAWTPRPVGLAGSEASGKGWLGASVALSGDATVAAIGAPRDLSPLDHVRNGAAWVFVEEPPSSIPAPVVTKIAPRRGSTAGGTEVVIRGGNFEEVKAVEFGAVAAASFKVSSTAEIVAVSPAESAGRVDVTVTTPTGTSSLSADDGFVFEAPEEEEIEKGKGAPKGGEPSNAKAPSARSSTPGGATASGGVQAFVASAGGCRVSVAKKRLAVTRYRSVALRLVRTGTGACRGSIALSYRIKARGGGFTLQTIGAASFSIPTGTTRVVTVKLSMAGEKWLRLHRGKGNASLAIARVVPAPTIAQSASVRLSLKKRRKASAVKH
jgi:hypothetical protein